MKSILLIECEQPAQQRRDESPDANYYRHGASSPLLGGVEVCGQRLATASPSVQRSSLCRPSSASGSFRVGKECSTGLFAVARLGNKPVGSRPQNRPEILASQAGPMKIYASANQAQHSSSRILDTSKACAVGSGTSRQLAVDGQGGPASADTPPPLRTPDA